MKWNQSVSPNVVGNGRGMAPVQTTERNGTNGKECYPNTVVGGGVHQRTTRKIQVVTTIGRNVQNRQRTESECSGRNNVEWFGEWNGNNGNTSDVTNTIGNR